MEIRFILVRKFILRTEKPSPDCKGGEAVLKEWSE